MVPKNWTAKLIVVRLLNLCVSLAAELRRASAAELPVDLDAPLDEQMRAKMQEVHVFGRVQRQAKASHELHQAYTQVI